MSISLPPYVVGVDPGKKCGLAWYRHDAFPAENRFRSCTLPSEEMIATLRTWLTRPYTHGNSTLVVCERYTIGLRTAKLTRQPRALEVIGVTRQLCAEENVPFELQGVSDAKKLGNPDVLKEIGWWKVGDVDDDANSAAAHVLLAIARHFPIVFRNLITHV